LTPKDYVKDHQHVESREMILINDESMCNLDPIVESYVPTPAYSKESLEAI